MLATMIGGTITVTSTLEDAITAVATSTAEEAMTLMADALARDFKLNSTDLC